MLIDLDGAPALVLSPAEATDATALLAGAGVRFVEDHGASAGCAGPESVVLRFPDALDVSALRERVADALGR